MYSGVPTKWPRLGEDGCSVEPLAPGRLGDAEVDDLGHRLAVLLGDEDVGRLEVAVDDALLVGVLHRLADRANSAAARRSTAGGGRSSR
jgi:hypothetical protein